MPYWLIPVIAYLSGSIPFGYLIVRVRLRADVRSAGSGNIGAANVSRVAGKSAGILTLLLDTTKGYLPVLLAAHVTHSSARWMILASVFAVIGHMFPVWLRFNGGKGVATGMGSLLPISALAIGLALLVWIVVVFLWRYSSLGSVAAAVVLPPLVYFLYAPGFSPPLPVTMGTTLICSLVIVKHRGNIQRLLAGTENRILSDR
jgi:acyl phosphate:glycerol-3-phosphate acyltransferase